MIATNAMNALVTTCFHSQFLQLIQQILF